MTQPGLERDIESKEYCHDGLVETFETDMSSYDVVRRLETLVDDFLGPVSIGQGGLDGLKVLDVGCGLGHFSERAAQQGAQVTAMDLGPRLVEKTKERVGCEALVGDVLQLTSLLEPGSFDVVLSSECVEHTPDPLLAVQQMAAMVRPGGWLSVSTPNRVWQPVVRAASRLKLRPFDGLENFVTWNALRSTLDESGLSIVRQEGLHLWPFHSRMYGALRWCDSHMQALKGVMINMCVLAQKK